MPKMIVRARAFFADEFEDFRRLWWAHVMETPEERRTAVLSRGTAKGFRGSIPTGGQNEPREGDGARLEWKKAQKKEKKKATSEIINISIPALRPVVTKEVWCPNEVPSRDMSRHHWIMVKRTTVIPPVRQMIDIV